MTHPSLRCLLTNDSRRWRKELPKSATRQGRVSVIQRLKDSGICEEAKERRLHDFAENEVEGVSKPLKVAVERELNRGLSQMQFSARELPCSGTQNAETTSGRPVICVQIPL